MTLPNNKTKIVCTIGPASESVEVLERMILAGMNVARLNFSHGDFESHSAVIRNVRAASQAAGRRVAIMGDLPGPKIRIGQLAEEPVELDQDDAFTLTTDHIIGDRTTAYVNLATLPQVVRPGDMLFLNDGIIQMEATEVRAGEVCCRVVVGGELWSRKGLNLPGLNLGIRAFTEDDRRWLKFAIEQGVDAVSQSFVESAADIVNVRRAAEELGGDPYIIAKIERAAALNHMDAILHKSDAIMVARGDLGVETPIEQIAIVQKRLIQEANLLGKPVITATQMLESMTGNRRPTRAESTDVANAILDGTDCVMLSGESATGRFPVDSVKMLARIAAAVEPHVPVHRVREGLKPGESRPQMKLTDLIALSVLAAVEKASTAAVIVPTRSGASARGVARFRLPLWITAVSSEQKTCQRLQFTYGVHPVHEQEHPEDWRPFARNWLRSHGIQGNLVVITEGPSRKHPETNNRMEIIDLGPGE